MKSEQEFAIFISDAPRGRKWGAILSIIAALVLAVALFVPSFSFGVPGSGTLVESYGLSADNMEEAREELNQLMPEGAEPVTDILLGDKISVVAYLVKYEPAFQNYVNYFSNGESTGSSGIMGILLLALLTVFILVSLVCALYTINVVSFIMGVCTITGILLVYMLRFRAGFFDFIKAMGTAEDMEAVTNFALGVIIHIGLPLILLLVLAGILQIVGLVLSYVIRDDYVDEFGEDELWTDNGTEGRDLETGLVGDNAEAGFNLEGRSERNNPAATLLQMNTNKRFLIQDNSEQILGKGTQVDIILQNPVVSREHAKITCSNGRCFLKDLGSKNGTFLNERQLRASEVVQLTSGDYITLGNEILKFEQ